MSGLLSTVKLLLSLGADTNMVSFGELSAMDIAAAREHKVLLCSSTTLLHIYSTLDHQLIETYLEAKTKVISQQQISKTLRLDIFEAAKRGDYDVIKHLVEFEHADVNRKDDDGATILMFAAMRGHSAVVELLVAMGAGINDQDDISGWTSLMQATYYGS